jgi:arylsulfatase
MGFSVPETFGGPVPMPTLERLAKEGLRFNDFQTTALCSPTRAALESGRTRTSGRRSSTTVSAASTFRTTPTTTSCRR